MNLHCDRCKETHPVVIKMGGLICSSCRIILKYPHEDEYRTARAEAKAKADAESSRKDTKET